MAVKASKQCRILTVVLAAASFSAAACTSDKTAIAKLPIDSIAQPNAITLVDDAGFTVTVPRPAQRIISLIPSAMETLIAIGATNQVVGRTRYDVAPEVASVPSVGGGIDPSVEAMINLHPDLVITWESDKRQEVRQKLTALGIPVFILRTQDTTDIFQGIASIGRLSGHDSAASAVAASVRGTLDSVRQAATGRPRPNVLYVAFNDPPMTTGPNTFTGQLISLAGGRSIFMDATQNWPTVAMEEIVRRDPDILVVPVGEFKTNTLERFGKMPGWRDLRAVRTGKVFAVPADLMGRPSPSIAEASRVLARVLHSPEK